MKFVAFPTPPNMKRNYSWHVLTIGWQAEVIKNKILEIHPEAKFYGPDMMTRIYDSVRLEIRLPDDGENAMFLFYANAGKFNP